MSLSEVEALGLAALQNGLAMADLMSQPGSSGQVELLILRRHDVELRMYKESAHARPHFHIEYKTQFSASYALDDFTLLAGDVPRRYVEPLLRWAREHQLTLSARWNELNERESSSRVTRGNA